MKTMLLVMLSVVIGAVLTGCTGFLIEVMAPEMAVAASDPSAAVSPTLTSTPRPVETATQAPTNTPRPTSTPVPATTPKSGTATPRPTVQATRQTPAPTATVVDDSDQLLRLQDLPPGFQRIDPMAMGLSEEALASSPVAIESVFAFASPEGTEFIGGGTTRLATFFDRIAFDLMLSNPELITSLVLSNLENVTLTGLQDMGLPLIGDNSKGLTVVVEVDEVQMRANLILFRKGSQGVALAQLYPNEDDPTAALSDLANIMAQRAR